jgi:TrmH family RNA methyltransferase
VSRSAPERFRAARRDPALAVLEGFHPLKHALRFGAAVLEVLCVDRTELRRLCAALAPDVAPALEAAAIVDVDEATFAAAAPRPPRPVLALAERPAPPLPILEDAPVVLLDRPTHHGNLGAVVRVAAAAGAGGVVALGGADPWHPAALRGGAGLQYAVASRHAGPGDSADVVGARTTVAVVPDAPPMAGPLPRGVALMFGSEREGLRAELRATADRSVGIPMREGVSSLNLATSVAVMLYANRS